jgi:DNA-binding MarR family transcriptional regulator
MRRNFQRAERAGIKLMQASGAIHGATQDLFKAHGLSEPQYNVLRILRGAGPDGLRCQEIADRMISRVPDITRLLDRLVDKGFVDRRRSEADRRMVISVVTRAGLDLLTRIDGPLQEQVRRNFRTLDADEIARLDDLLDKLLGGLAADGR